MGLWWKNVNKIPKGGVSFAGDPKAWPKWNPLWRFQHKWRIIKVENWDGEQPYFVYFNSGSTSMVVRKPITTKQFAVRIGLEDVSFAAVVDKSDEESLSLDPLSDSYDWEQMQLLNCFNDISGVTSI